MSLEQVARVAAALKARPNTVTLQERRERFERVAESFHRPPDMTEERIVLRQGLEALWIGVEGVADDRAILWLHGGAFALGSARSYRHLAARLARAAGARVLLLDYRLTPEHPFPAAFEDACFALAAMARLGVALDNLALGGDSAGANLALAATQSRLAADGSAPAALLLLSGYFDLTHSGDSVQTRAARDAFVDVSSMPATAGAYLGGADPRDPRASPLFGEFAPNFPRTLIQVGSEEALFDDSLRVAKRIRAAGAEITFQEWAGMLHAWPYFVDQIDEGQWALEQIGAFCRLAWAEPR